VKEAWQSAGQRPTLGSWTDYTMNKLGYCWDFRCIIEDFTETEDHSMVRALSCATSKLSRWVYLVECFRKTVETSAFGFKLVCVYFHLGYNNRSNLCFGAIFIYDNLHIYCKVIQRTICSRNKMLHYCPKVWGKILVALYLDGPL